MPYAIFLLLGFLVFAGYSILLVGAFIIWAFYKMVKGDDRWLTAFFVVIVLIALI